MKKNKKKKIFKIIFIIILIISTLVILFLYFLKDTRVNNVIFSLTKDISASISRVVSIPYNKVNVSNNDISKEINKDYEKEIENLKKALELKNSLSDKKLINASVTKRSTAYWYNIITIDKGSKNDIKEGQAVINSSGLIGKVIKVNKYSSDIKLLTSKNNDNSISAVFYINDVPYYGLIDEYNIEKNELYLKNVIGDFKQEEIKNINVTTSGLSDSFKSGLLIGKIKEIKKETYGISNEIVITPSADFNDLKIVTVVGDKK